MNREESQQERYRKIGYHLCEFLRLGNKYNDLEELKKLIKIDQEQEILERLLV